LVGFIIPDIAVFSCMGRVLLVAVLVVMALACAGVGFGKKKQNAAALEMDQPKRVFHALNRLTFGPRPGEADQVMSMGIDKWIDLQLHPEKIDDSALDARLAPLRTLRMNTRELVENFPPPLLIRAIAEGKQSLPRDPAKRAVYQAQLERYQARQDSKSQAATPEKQESAEDTPKEKRTADEKAQELLDLPPDQRMKAILAMSPEEQRKLARSSRGKRPGINGRTRPQATRDRDGVEQSAAGGEC
jgi:hypothetical protein